MQRSTKLAFATLVLSALVACTGEQGPTGPTGPAGVAGPQGPQGVQGPPGTANVISGEALLVDDDWSTSTVQIGFSTSNSGVAFGKPARYYDIALPELADGAYAGGAVLVYMQPDPVLEPEVFVPLPFSFLFLSGSSQYHYEIEIRGQSIRLLFIVEDQTNPGTFGDPLTPNQADRTFRWVLIPPAALPMMTSALINEGADATLAALANEGFEVELNP